MYGSSDVYLHYTQALNFRVGDFIYFDLILNGQGQPQAQGLLRSDDFLNPHAIPTNGVVLPTQQTHAYSNSNYPQLQPLHPASRGNAYAYAATQATTKGGVRSSQQFDTKRQYIGHVKSYNADKGYGFIDCGEVKAYFQGRDVWVSKQEVEKYGVKVGDEVAFKVRIDPKTGNPQAAVDGSAINRKIV